MINKYISGLLREIKLVFLALQYNTKIDEIIKKHNPPTECHDTTDFDKKWRPVFFELFEFAKSIQMPTYHIYSKNSAGSDEVKKLVRDIREYAQGRFGQCISFIAICFSLISFVISMLALLIK